ncbi:MAG: glycosyltransferase family 4 protein [Sedimentisphaeraceae bacterium JB056]
MKKKVAIITVYKAGWKTVRKRWEKFFVDQEDTEYCFYHLEDYSRFINYLTVKLDRFKTLWYISAGRAAVKAALKDGCSHILINTFHYIPLIPIKEGVKYFTYGDATAIQVVALQPRKYNDKSAEGALPDSIDRLYKKGLKRLNKADCIHIGMSQWYIDGLINDYCVPKENTVVIPFGLDTDLWKSDDSGKDANDDGLNILCVGAPFNMKGGPLLQEISEMPEFANCCWHFVAYDAHFESDDRRKYYTNITADTPELLDIYKKSDVMVLPTAADCSPNVAIEAAAMGLPVIITDIGATGEIVEDKKSGFLIPAPPKKDDIVRKLLWYIENREVLKQHSGTARKIALEKFDINTHLKKVGELISDS